ncbi:NAD(P)/FAD-dependent oxidoreductase [Hymenobacter metallilatus]|uniref:NAD(P)/FAD-dependent oxidoreductase n=1 Tax=Hymenobacter metallilatus TaxID=2493666 RepID=A0A3R9M510_9BACT|nr:NAD(P)/FAD-dependent oxidoreductase [Hymenobacter metallilatus]RSK29888.1 NAD(P)/FAD-dependent oxidoreductase [Hymenobacter metallilatus]
MQVLSRVEVLIVGGSYAGLAAALSLGRALRSVLVLDSGQPCNRQTPRAHNFLTQDGEHPAVIRAQGLAQVQQYPTVSFRQDMALHIQKDGPEFVVTTESGQRIAARKLIFASGIRDMLPTLPGFAECWGISVLHCPYCHGYEVRGQALGVLSNGEPGYLQARLIRNWTPHLTLFTNGPSTLDATQTRQLYEQNIALVETPIQAVEHSQGRLHHLLLQNEVAVPLAAVFTHVPFEQHTALPARLGCAFTSAGHVQVDDWQRTSVPGVYAAGDATTPMRSVANAVAAGTKAGAFVNHELLGL